MNTTSIIIPARNEQFLQKTITDVLEKASGEIEIIVILDGYWPNPPLLDHPNLIVLHWSQSKGMRQAINAGVAIAKGNYILKTDAHCLFGEGFDEILMADCEDNWVSVPRRKRLDPENWIIRDVGKPDIDYMYLSYPDNPNDWGGPGLNGKVWNEKNRDHELKKVLVDDLMSAQGSCWFMKRDYFYQLDLMDYRNYGPFWKEFQEIGLKCWLSGGRVIRNKNTYYAHLHKGKKYGRGYLLSKNSLSQGADHAKKWFKMGDAWPNQTLPLSWLIEKFWPVPTWKEGWEKEIKEILN